MYTAIDVMLVKDEVVSLRRAKASAADFADLSASLSRSLRC